MWDGRKWETGLTPKYEEWCKDRDEAVLVSPRRSASRTRLTRQDTEETIRRCGNDALAAMRDLQGLELGRDSRDLKV
jgi:hypothetical protein